MLVTFDKEYLKELYVSGKCSDKKHRFLAGCDKTI